MNTLEKPTTGKDLSADVCPIRDGTCDRKCGFGVHMTVKRKNQVIDIPEDPNDAMLCEGCQ